jgi:hypothetical protein
MLWKKEANGSLTNLSTTKYQASKWECVLWIHRTCFWRTVYIWLWEGGFVFKSTHRLHSWTNDRIGQLFWILWIGIVSSLSLNKTQCHKWEHQTDHSSLWSKEFIAILMGLSFLQILVHFSQLKQELRDARGIWTWSRNDGKLIFKENLSIISN